MKPPWRGRSATPHTQISSSHLDAPRSQVFPLFTAEGERGWAPGWNPEVLSGAAERGSAFRTKHENGQETIWVVTEYKPQEGRVSYARAALGSNIGLVDVVCTDSATGGRVAHSNDTGARQDAINKIRIWHFSCPSVRESTDRQYAPVWLVDQEELSPPND